MREIKRSNRLSVLCLLGKLDDTAINSPNFIDWLTRTIYGEARGESFEGKIAVAHVILNRARRGKANKALGKFWGNDVESVCLAPWQFSCWNENDPNLEKMLALDPGSDDPVVKECLWAAVSAFSGFLEDNTGGADHYYSMYCEMPVWASDKSNTRTFGRHDFYQLRGEDGKEL